MRGLIAITALASSVASAQPLPTVTVTEDDTVIERSCRVVIVSGRVVADANGDGVLHVKGDGITVEFMGGVVLQGADADARPDELTGVGIRIDGAKGVTLRNARVRGFRVGIHATNAPGLTIDGAEIHDNFRQHLGSTAAAEDSSDWLWPHRNDANEWMTSYGGALVIEDSEGVTVRKVKVRRGQNGIILDRVHDSKIYDNDCSFLSGWGLAMWRCSGNAVTRNALDFCVRGYSHGVYNRGQDSAGILFFEQNTRNVIAENSATHGGDGFFGFGGRDALGEPWFEAEMDRMRRETSPDVLAGARARLAAERGKDWEKRSADDVLREMFETPAEVTARHARKGNLDNLIINNDFSYAPAHGIELTFSFDNQVIGNRLVENAICGVWGGYSQDTLIASNTFEGNGAMAYGLERGGVNIEHGAGSRIIGNTFRKNACGVHLWWDVDEGRMGLPWAIANDRGGHDAPGRRVPSIDNLVADNTFEGDKVAIHLRDCDSTSVLRNRFEGVEQEIKATPGSEPATAEEAPVSWAMPEYPVHGTTKPVGAREKLRGRDKNVMTEWGPWDHQSPLVRLVSADGGTHTYEAYNLNKGAIKVVGVGIRTEISDAVPLKIVIKAQEPGVFPYALSAAQGPFEQDIPGTIVNATWDVAFFPWAAPEPRLDEQGVPRVPPDLAAWRSAADDRGAVRVRTQGLLFRHGGGGPSDAIDDPALKSAGLPRDYFGMIARTRLPLRTGTWRLTTTSDDGVRVLVDGKPVLENWTHHGPARDSGEFTIDADRTVEVVVEHFEIMGFAVLEVALERAG